LLYVPSAALEMIRPASAFACTCIPVAVTVVFIENHAKVEVLTRIAEMRSITIAGISLRDFFIVGNTFHINISFGYAVTVGVKTTGKKTSQPICTLATG